MHTATWYPFENCNRLPRQPRWKNNIVMQNGLEQIVLIVGLKRGLHVSAVPSQSRTWPASISYISTPSAHQSTEAPYGSSFKIYVVNEHQAGRTSGAM